MKIERIVLKNFLIIKHSEIELSDKLNIVTGETGSGKSLFVSAFRLLKGERAQKELIGKWGNKGEVSAIFKIENEGIKSLIKKFDLELNENNSLTIRRIFGAKNSIYINGSLVTLSTLEKIFSSFIEISSQFENRELFKKEYLFNLLDKHSLSNELKKEWNDIFRKYQNIRNEISRLEKKQDLKKIDYLMFQINEIKELNLTFEEAKNLEEQVSFLENQEKIVEIYNELESDFASLNLLFTKITSNLAEFDKLLKPKISFLERINSISIESEDVSMEISKIASAFDDNDIDETAKEKFDTLNRLLFKHNSTSLEELFEKLKEMEAELSELEKIPQTISELNFELSILMKKLEKTAKEMEDNRIKKIPVLENKIKLYLKKFGMGNLVFKIKLSSKDIFDEFGKNDLFFGVNTVGGEEIHKLSSLSGGELSRMLLAFKLVDEETGKFILFDEIDSNIGGETAVAATNELKKNSDKNQMVVITHFPQTAAKGEKHFVVLKDFKNDTVTSIIEIKNEKRVKELARMLGDSSSQNHLELAKQLLT